MSSANRQMLYAGVEHRAWVAAFEAYLQGKRVAPPSLDPHQCRFGVWVEGVSRTHTTLPSKLQSIQFTHLKLHSLAREIFITQAQDRPRGLSRLAELHDFRDRLLLETENYRDESETG